MPVPVSVSASDAEAMAAYFGPIRLIVIQPTSFCNIDCSYCYLPDRSRLQRMSTNTVEGSLKFALLNHLVYNPAHIVWHAGEPLTLPMSFYEQAFSLASSIAQARRPAVRVEHSLQTNGMLLDQSWCDLFRKYGVEIGISLDGPSGWHDARRRTRTGSGTFEKVIKGLRLLVKNELSFSVITVLSTASLRDPDRLFEFYQEHSIKRVAFNIDEITGSNKRSEIVDEDSEALFRHFMDRMMELSEHSPLSIREVKRHERKILGNDTSPSNLLSWPLSTLCIDWEGNFSTFCPELLTAIATQYPEGFTIGNVFTDSLQSAITSPRFMKMHHEIERGVQKCRATCEYFGLCGGGAPSNKLFENGTFDSAETAYCRYTRKVVIDVVLAHLENRFGIRQASLAPGQQIHCPDVPDQIS